MRKDFSKFLVLSILIFIGIINFLIYVDIKKSSKSTTGEIKTVQQKYKYLGKLATEVQIDYFKELLGNPTFINYSKDRTTKEYVFIDKLFYVQAITNSDDKVLSYAVTSRDENFNPVFNNGLFQTSLVKTVFGDISNKFVPQKCYSFRSGATASSFYFEESYLGNAGNYQTYLYGFNDAGFISGENDKYFPVLEKPEAGYEVDCKKLPKAKRDKFKINTYVVIAPFINVKELQVDFVNRHFGVERHQVRLISN